MASPQPPDTMPPLALSTVKQRYPRLYRQYNILSDREKECMVNISDVSEPPVVDPVTGQCTTISFTDFTKPLEDNGDCPMMTKSDANKFCIFIWKVLNACESGSIGGDACRQFQVLNCALDDTLAMPSVSAKFEHLLGWTAAATNHGLHALLYRGDPDRNKSLFKAVADEWKKVYEKTANNAINGVSEALRKFAIWMCESFQKLLKDAKKEYGEDAKYTFNFVKKPRAKKLPMTLPKTVVPAPLPPPPQRKIVTVVVTKPSKDVKLGLGIAQEKGTSTIKVTSMAPTSLFQGSELKVGMILYTINGINYATFAEGSALLKGAEGQVTIVAITNTRATTPPPPPAAAKVVAPPSARATASISAAVAAAASSIGTGSYTYQKENSIPSKNSSSESDDEPKPWVRNGFVPMSGRKQMTPNMVRNELQKYIDLCKADGTMTQTAIIEKMGVNNVSACFVDASHIKSNKVQVSE